MSDLIQSIRERYLSTLEKISDAANRAGRDPESVKLVVVTKAQPVEVARAAIEARVIWGKITLKKVLRSFNYCASFLR